MINIQTPSWSNYELLDSGNGRKLERFGKFILDRIETQALWNKSLSEAVWQSADAIFKKKGDQHGDWARKNNIPDHWTLEFEGLKLQLRLTPFGHVGIFPDQSTQWEWIQSVCRPELVSGPQNEMLNSHKGTIHSMGSQVQHDKSIKVLSLFTYTGAATLAAAVGGAQVTHVDASKPAITWARENQNLSGLSDKPIRWIPEDALKFVKREVRRGTKYDAIIMDPPKFGRGTQGEVWKFEENFPELLDNCLQIISDSPQFILITAYAIPISSITLSNMLADMMKKYGGTVEAGELGLKQSKNERILPTAIYAKWIRD